MINTQCVHTVSLVSCLQDEIVAETGRVGISYSLQSTEHPPPPHRVSSHQSDMNSFPLFLNAFYSTDWRILFLYSMHIFLLSQFLIQYLLMSSYICYSINMKFWFLCWKKKTPFKSFIHSIIKYYKPIGIVISFVRKICILILYLHTL